MFKFTTDSTTGRPAGPVTMVLSRSQNQSKHHAAGRVSLSQLINSVHYCYCQRGSLPMLKILLLASSVSVYSHNFVCHLLHAQ